MSIVTAIFIYLFDFQLGLPVYQLLLSSYLNAFLKLHLYQYISEVLKNCHPYLVALLWTLKCESYSCATLNSNAKFKQILGQSHVDIWNMASKVNGHNGDCWWPVNVQNGSSAAAAAAPGRQASWPQSSSAVTMTARVFYNSGEQEARLGTARSQSRTTLQPVAWHEATAAEHRVKMVMRAQCTQLHMITKQQEEEREWTGGAACTLLLLQAFCCRTLQLELKAVTVTHCLGSLCTSLPHIHTYAQQMCKQASLSLPAGWHGHRW